jgi:hypothetical protein
MIKEFINNKYEIDTSNCKCGSDNIIYEVNQKVREQGASERHIVKTVISEQLDKCYCPDCEAEFGFCHCI